MTVLTRLTEAFEARQPGSRAVLDVTSVDIAVNGYTFRATGSVVKFQGFMVLYTESRDEPNPEEEDEKAPLPPLTVEKPTRLDLAHWVVDPANPLPGRVIVNRIWQQYFGRGLVETENDFGTQGTPPTHPELLDWLATEFIARGWNMKAMHRLIMTSTVYRQSSRRHPAKYSTRPGNGV